MIRSMTAYANLEATMPEGWLACAVRAVNSRFLETAVRLPDELRTLEPQLSGGDKPRCGRTPGVPHRVADAADTGDVQARASAMIGLLPTSLRRVATSS